MKKVLKVPQFLPFALLFVASFYGCGSMQQLVKQSSIHEIILVGEDQVMIMDYEKSTPTNKHINWQLKSSEIQGLPDSLHKYFTTLDDAKSVDNDSKLLISASSGGVVLVDRETKECLFYSKATNAHSVEYLPNDRIVVALSTGSGGNSVQLYDANQSDVPLFTDSLYSGHGVTWNEERGLLYALGFDKMRAYSLKNWDAQHPELTLEHEWELPEIGGHDLFAPTANNLLISTNKAVWEFDLSKEQFTPFQAIATEENVKSVYFDEETTEIVYTKGEVSWWTHQVHLLNPEKRFNVPEIKLYKIRVIKKTRQ